MDNPFSEFGFVGDEEPTAENPFAAFGYVEDQDDGLLGDVFGPPLSLASDDVIQREAGFPAEEPNLLESIGGVAVRAPHHVAQAAGGVLQDLGNLLEPVGDVANIIRGAAGEEPGLNLGETLQDSGTQAGEFARRELEERPVVQRPVSMDEDTPEWLRQQVTHALDSFSLMAPGIAAAAVTRSPKLAQAVFGSTVYGRAFDQAKSEGVDDNEAQDQAIKETVFELAFELPIFRSIAKPASGVVKQTAKVAGQEMLAEQGTELLTVADEMAEGKVPALMDFLERMLGSGIGGLVLGGGAGAVSGRGPATPLEEGAAQAEADLAGLPPPTPPEPATDTQAHEAAEIARDAIDTGSEAAEALLNPTVPPVAPMERDSESGGIEPTAPAESDPNPLTGRESRVFTPTGREVSTRFRLVDLDDVLASHTPDGTPVPDFPERLQPRDRSRAASRQSIGLLARNWRQELAGENPQAAHGAIITAELEDGRRAVVSGNGRHAAQQLIHAQLPEKAAEVREKLKAQVAELGMDPGLVDQLHKPALVREVAGGMDDAQLAEIAREANQEAIQRYSPAEQAGGDAERIRDLMHLFRPDESGNVLAASNREFLNEFARRLGPEQTAGLQTSDGRWTKQMADRVQAAVFAEAYQDDSLLALAAEEADPDIKNILNALNQVAPAYAPLRGADDAPDVAEPIVDAVNIVRAAKEQGAKVRDYLKQVDAFDRPDRYAAEVADFLDQNVRSPKRMADGLRRIADLAQTETQNRAQVAGLFGDARTESSDLIARGLEESRVEQQAPQQARIFTPRPEPAQIPQVDDRGGEGGQRLGRGRAEAETTPAGERAPTQPAEEVNADQRGAAKAAADSIRQDFPGVKLQLSARPTDGLWTLDNITVPEGQREQGTGTQVMQRIMEAADQAGARVALSPTADFGANKKRLTEFYRRFGFKKNTDPAISETMVREPQTAEPLRQAVRGAAAEQDQESRAPVTPTPATPAPAETGMPSEARFTIEPRPDGTLLVRGDVASIRGTLNAKGVKDSRGQPVRGIPAKGGLLFGTSQADGVSGALDPEAGGAEATPAPEPPPLAGGGSGSDGGPPTITAPPGDSFSEENDRIRDKDRTTWRRARQLLKRSFSPGGLLPQSVFDEQIFRDAQFNAIDQIDVPHAVGKLEQAVRADFGKPFRKLDDDQQRTLHEALAGQASDSIPERTRTVLVAMRQYVDKLSGQYVEILGQQVERLEAEGSPEAAVKAELLETITGNIGEYVHRSYQAFDDPKWHKKVPDQVLNDAREYLTRRYVEQGETDAEAARLAEVVLHEILKNGTAYDSMEGMVKESKLGAKDLSVLKRRKAIAPEIRALLGEYIDPRINFAKTATKMGRLIWNETFLQRVREKGLGVFLFEGTDRPPEATKQLAGEASEVYSPLNGLWTFPDVEQSFRDALGKEQMAHWYRNLVMLNGYVKAGKTVLSPVTAARNWQSAFFFAVANGHFDFRHIAKSVEGLREYFTQQGSGAKLKYLRRLKELGVVYDNPYAGQLMDLIRDSRIDEKLIAGKGQLGAKTAFGYAQKFYQYGDDFWKIVGFENEKRLLMKHAGMSESEAEVEAAERVRNTYPTYSMVGRSIKSLRRFPLVGAFVSFTAEVIRTSFNILGYIAKDAKTPGMRPIAAKRAAGMAVASGWAYALQEVAKSLLGVDDDEEEAVRELAAPWNRNSNLLFLGRDEEGRLRYEDLSFLDPYNYFKRPITAILRDEPWEDQAVEILREALEPFLGTDIAAGAIWEVANNKRRGSGSPIYRENDLPHRQALAIAEHLAKAIQPGLTSQMARTWKAIQGDYSPSGKQYDLLDESLAWIGHRVSTLDPKVALYYRSFEFGDGLNDAQADLYRKLRDPNEVSEKELLDSYELTLRLRKRAFEEMGDIVHAARKAGMSDEDMAQILVTAGVSKMNVAHLLRDKIPPWRPSKSSLRGNARRAAALFGEERAREIMERYQTVGEAEATP